MDTKRIVRKFEKGEELTSDEKNNLENAVYVQGLSEKGKELLREKFYEIWFYYQLSKQPDLKWITSSNDALNFYKTNYGYKLLNSVLRGMKPINIAVSGEKIKDLIRLIDSSLNKKQTGKQVFRGVKKHDFFNIIPNSFYKEEAYSSTSTDFCVSVNFSPVCCIFSFEIPKNVLSYDFLDHDKTSTGTIMKDEQEILLEKNIVYHIGEPIEINESIFYPCVISKDKKGKDKKGKDKKGKDKKGKDKKDKDKDDKIVKQMKKQTEYLIEFKKSKYSENTTAEEILSKIEKEMDNMKKKFPITPYEFMSYFNQIYEKLCLDMNMYNKVYNLAKVRYPLNLPVKESSCVVS